MKSSLHTVDEGQGPPLVLLHAFPLSSQMWKAQIEAWRTRYRVLAPDWRGFGNSPPSFEETSMERCADDLHQLLTDLQVTAKVILLGLSMGGYVAFEFMRKYSKSVGALILVATQPVADTEEAKKTRYESADLVLEKGTAALAEKMIPRLLGRTSIQTRPAIVEQVRALISSNPAKSIAAALRGLAHRRDSGPVLKTIQVPTLVVAGTEDVIISVETMETMHRKVVGSVFVGIEESGHLINLEQQEKFHGVVDQFLARLPKQERA